MIQILHERSNTSLFLYHRQKPTDLTVKLQPFVAHFPLWAGIHKTA